MMSWVVWGAQLPGYLHFQKALKNPGRVQQAKLREILASLEGTETARTHKLTSQMGYREFTQALPMTDYDFWQSAILRQKETGASIVCHDVQRYQPTSGSTSAQKYIPYSKLFMREMDAALQPWLGDVGVSGRSAFGGSQYWSLSWLPESQRASHPGNNDLDLLPAWKAYILNKTMAVPSGVTTTHTMDESMFSTLCYLCGRADLSLVSVWSPTFWLVLLNHLEEWRFLLADTLLSGQWQWPGWSSQLAPPPVNVRAAQILRTESGEELYRRLWPRLSFISCWDSAGSQPWAAKIREKHPGVRVQGKGLWATEGVFTLPFQNQYPAAITSHFFEWLDVDTQKIMPTWELRKGQTVQPLISSGSGILRYRMSDALQVTGFLQNTPTFEFKGRLRETDLVGEKLSNQLVSAAFDAYSQISGGVRPISILAVRTKEKTPYYMVLSPDCSTDAQALERCVEDSLAKIFNYKLARELGQLAPVRVQRHAQPEQIYYQAFMRKGMLRGDIKLEALAEISEEHLF